MSFRRLPIRIIHEMNVKQTNKVNALYNLKNFNKNYKNCNNNSELLYESVREIKNKLKEIKSFTK